MRRIILSFISIIGIFVPMMALGSEPFDIGFDDWIGSAPLFLAREKGFYHGVDVRFHRIDTEDRRRADLASGRLQMICETMGMFETGRNTSDYYGKLIFALDESRGADGVLATDEIKSVEDLKRKKVVGQYGMPSHLILIAALARKGMRKSDLEFLNMPMREAVINFVDGKADALCSHEPHITSALKKRPGAHLLLSSSDFPGIAVHFAIIKEDTMSARRVDIENIYEGWTTAVSYMKDHPEESEQIISKAIGYPADEVRRMISGLKFFDREENEKYFNVGSPCCPSEAAETFNLMGRGLKENGLTNAVSPGSERIELSIIGSVKMKRTSPTATEPP